MGRKATTIELSDEDRGYLESLVRARTQQAQVVYRARILLMKADGDTADDIADKLILDRKSVLLCVSKYREGGIDNALYDAPGRGRNPEITDEEKAWVINIACQSPVSFGYPASTWTLDRLTKHINRNAEEAGYARLSTIVKSTVSSILKEGDIHPDRVRYYCERRDERFDEKMHNVLLVYRQLSMQFDDDGNLLPFGDGEVTHVVSFDEKPGIQAIGTTSDDLLPDERCGEIKRDYEYRRFGTVVLFAGIDLQTGRVIPLVSDVHGSGVYIEFLKKLDEAYPKGDKIRMVLDNLYVHRSKETRAYLATNPGRFEFVFTPTHGSWLNQIESFFGKLTKQLLTNLRVTSKDDLKQRLYAYFDEVNREPVVHHWTYNIEDLDVAEGVKVTTLLES